MVSLWDIRDALARRWRYPALAAKFMVLYALLMYALCTISAPEVFLGSGWTRAAGDAHGSVGGLLAIFAGVNNRQIELFFLLAEVFATMIAILNLSACLPMLPMIFCCLAHARRRGSCRMAATI